MDIVDITQENYSLLPNTGLCSVDVETTGLKRNSIFICAAIYFDKTTYFIIEHKLLIEFVNNFNGKIITHSGYDYRYFSDKMENTFFDKYFNKTQALEDTSILAYCINENQSISLINLVNKFIEQTNYKDFWEGGSLEKYSSYQDVPEERKQALREYNAKDAYYTYQLYHILTDLLDYDMYDLYRYLIELQFNLKMFSNEGIKIDFNYALQKEQEMQGKIQSIKEEFIKTFYKEIIICRCIFTLKEIKKYKTDKKLSTIELQEFSLDSTHHLQYLVYNVLGIPEQKNYKTKKVSFDKEAIKNIAQKDVRFNSLIEYRKHSKILSSFLEPLTELAIDDIIYPDFKVTSTATARISGQNPNLQQLPREGGIRGCYIPRDGYVFISADFTSLEVVLAADITQDENLLKVTTSGVSLHDLTKDSLGITKDKAKSVNFSLQYGGTKSILKKILGCSDKKAEELYTKYWDTYSGLKKRIDYCKNLVDLGLPIVNRFHFKRRFEKKSRTEFDEAYRQCFNSEVQSTGAIITNKAYIEFNRYLRENNYGRALFPIHDEILAEVKKEFADIAKTKLVGIMVSQGDKINMSIPLKAEPSDIMYRWED